MSQDKEGRTIRLDQKTGEIAVVNGDKLVSVRSEQEQIATESEKRRREDALAELKAWPPKDLNSIGVSDTTLFTSWRDGKLRYQIELKPVPKGFDSSYVPTPLTLTFSDKAGFEVVKIELTRANLSHVVDADGKPVAISANASIACSMEDYESLVGWSLGWRF